MSRNDDRIPGDSSGTPPQDLPGLDFATPTEFVELPSAGKYYPEGHPLHLQDTVEIRYMTAKDEDTLTSKALLRKGVAVERFLQGIIVDKRIKIDDLLVGDKNAIVVAARVTGYGSDYETKINCPSCGEISRYEFDLGTASITTGSLDILGASFTAKGTVVLPLPSTKWQVEMRLMTGQDEKWLAATAEKKKKHKLPESTMTDQFKRLIVSINGIEDPIQVSKAVDNMPALDSKYLRLAYKKVVPNIDLTQSFSCEKCNAEQEVSVPFTADFFWPQ